MDNLVAYFPLLSVGIVFIISVLWCFLYFADRTDE